MGEEGGHGGEALVQVEHRVLRASYAAARARHAAAREEAYAATREEALAQGLCGPDLRLADIDHATLLVWERSWTGTHPSGAGRWNWNAIVERLPRRAAVLPIAIWYGEDLCGLAAGQASRHRASGVRHTVTLMYVERRPAPPDVPLRGRIATLAAAAARAYGLALGARRLRLRNPDRNLLRYYGMLGFDVAWKSHEPVYCEQEILP